MSYNLFVLGNIGCCTLKQKGCFDVGKLLFLNEEAQKMILSETDKEHFTPEDDYLTDGLNKLVQAVRKGKSYSQVKKEVDPIEFARQYWMFLYHDAKTQKEKKEAVLELRRLMLIDGKNNDLVD